MKERDHLQEAHDAISRDVTRAITTRDELQQSLSRAQARLEALIDARDRVGSEITARAALAQQAAK